MKNELQRLFGLPYEKINVIPNGVNLDTYEGVNRDLEFRREYARDEEKIILYIGRLVYEKGVQNLIGALPKILNYYTELNDIGFSGKYEYSDKGNKEYPIFRKIISYYEKEKNYNDAITLCDIAINNGIYKYFRNISIKDKKEELLKLVK